MTNINGTFVNTSFRDKPVFFFVKDPNDTIQSQHAAGLFYEIEEIVETFKRYEVNNNYLIRPKTVN